MKSMSDLGWFATIGSAGQLFATVVVFATLLVNPWTTEPIVMYNQGTYQTCTAPKTVPSCYGLLLLYAFFAASIIMHT